MTLIVRISSRPSTRSQKSRITSPWSETVSDVGAADVVGAEVRARADGSDAVAAACRCCRRCSAPWVLRICQAPTRDDDADQAHGDEVVPLPRLAGSIGGGGVFGPSCSASRLGRRSPLGPVPPPQLRCPLGVRVPSRRRSRCRHAGSAPGTAAVRRDRGLMYASATPGPVEEAVACAQDHRQTPPSCRTSGLSGSVACQGAAVLPRQRGQQRYLAGRREDSASRSSWTKRSSPVNSSVVVFGSAAVLAVDVDSGSSGNRRIRRADEGHHTEDGGHGNCILHRRSNQKIPCSGILVAVECIGGYHPGCQPPRRSEAVERSEVGLHRG